MLNKKFKFEKANKDLGIKKNSFISIICFALITTILLSEYFHWVGNSYSFLFLHDAYTQTFPWMGKVLEGWKSFDIPLWTWGSGLGTSLIGELQPGVLYPFTILASIFPLNEINTINVLIFLHAFIAGSGVLACGIKLKSNVFLASILGISWSYYLLQTQGFGQANLYYGFCYISWISAIFLDVFKSYDNSNCEFSPYPSLRNSFSLAILLSLSVLAGHTYATVGIAAYWIVYGLIASFNSKKFVIRRDGIINWIVCFTTFAALTSGQLISTSEYFKISRKWYGLGSTIYPHIVPHDVIRDFGVSLSQIFSQFILGKRINNEAAESYMMEGINIIIIFSIILCLGCFFIKSRSRKLTMLKRDQKKNLLKNDNSNLIRSNTLILTSLIIVILSFLPKFEPIGIELFGARLYKLIPILNLVRLPGRLLPIAEMGFILSFLSYWKSFNFIFNTRNKKILETGIVITLLILIFNQSLYLNRDIFINKGIMGMNRKTNPEFLLKSDCNKFFNNIRNENYGLISLEIDNNNSLTKNNLPKNLGDIPNYPRFVNNFFRSSRTLNQMKADKKQIPTLQRINEDLKDSIKPNLSCNYDGETFIFGNVNDIENNRFNSFIFYPFNVDIDRSLISKEMEIRNHKIIFQNALKIEESLYSNDENRPFIKVPYYPGWKIKTKHGGTFDSINYKSFLGLPKGVYGREITEIFYFPKWIFFVYFQLNAWVLVFIFFICDLLKVNKKI